jgi:hypothetical protein
VGPSGIAPPALDKLSSDIRAVLEAWMRAEIARWARIARDANLKAE